MNSDEIIEIVAQLLPPERFGTIERFIIHQSWQGRTYGEMALSSSYASDYLKDVGFRLWNELSKNLKKKVTKKNIHLVLPSYQQVNNGGRESQVKLEQREDFAGDDALMAMLETEPRFPSGPVPLSSPFYIERPPIERLAYREIYQPGCVIRIRASKKMGKSSLLNRILAYAQNLGYVIVNVDFQEADKTIFTSLDNFLRWFCTHISRQLHIEPNLEDYWDGEIGSKVSCRIYFEGYLLEQVDKPLVLALNEINQVFEYPSIAKNFLPMLRSWHEQAQQDILWQKLRLVIVQATESYVQLNFNQSPFNVGLSLQLPPLKLEQVQNLAGRYGINWKDGAEARQLMGMLGGHPYLISIALYYLQWGKLTMEELLATAPTLSGIYGFHLRELLIILQETPQLAAAWQRVVTADESVLLEAHDSYRLESLGLIQFDGDLTKPSCDLYRLYFRKQFALLLI